MKTARFLSILALIAGLSPMASRAEGDGGVDSGVAAVDPTAFKSPLKDRPLFSPTRSPPIVPEIVDQTPEEAPAPVVEASSPPPWRLVGVIRKSSGALALFSVEGGASFQLRQGDERDGWTLAEVGRRDAVLKDGERVHMVKMGANPVQGIEPGSKTGEGQVDPVGNGNEPALGGDPNALFDENGLPIDPSLAPQPGLRGQPPKTGQNPTRREAVRKVGERPQRQKLTPPTTEAPQAGDLEGLEGQGLDVRGLDGTGQDALGHGFPGPTDGVDPNSLGTDGTWPDVIGTDGVPSGVNR